MATQQLIYINYSSLSEANTPVVAMQGNSTSYCYYFYTLSFFGVTVPLSLPILHLFKRSEAKQEKKKR
ncbi:hypothetical protein XENTR_v10018548 [Xenopus tropicalis]|nr:hypothetical protein XENTR_v10018548 [Xenopus tropicalis]